MKTWKKSIDTKGDFSVLPTTKRLVFLKHRTYKSLVPNAKGEEKIIFVEDV